MTLLELLRVETRPAHRALEAELDLMRPDLGLAEYRQCLARFYGFYRPLEGRIFDSGIVDWTAVGLDPGERRKTGWLEEDLAELGIDSTVLPCCTDLPGLEHAAAVFGSLYVLEGATLGGRVISRHLQATLGIGPATGARFHYGYGASGPAAWQSFRSVLVAYSSSLHDRRLIIDSACATFESLRRWCHQERDSK